MSLVPNRAFLTAGSASHEHELVAFELALREAGIAAQNLVTVSSILPPGCPLVDREEGRAALVPGQILHVVMSRAATRDTNSARVATIGIARPRDARFHGFIAEHAGDGDPGAEEAAAVDLAGTMLASSLPRDSASASEIVHVDDLGGIESTASISAVARADDRGHWSVAVACCVLLLDTDRV